MRSTAVEETEEELRQEINELLPQQRQISERHRSPPGFERGGLSDAGPRNFAANVACQGDLVRPFQADGNEAEDQPPTKRRLLSGVVKVEDGETIENDADKEQLAEEGNIKVGNVSVKRPSTIQQGGWSTGDGTQREVKKDNETLLTEHMPGVFPKNEGPSLVSINKRMSEQLLGTLEISNIMTSGRNKTKKVTDIEIVEQMDLQQHLISATNEVSQQQPHSSSTNNESTSIEGFAGSNVNIRKRCGDITRGCKLPRMNFAMNRKLSRRGAQNRAADFGAPFFINSEDEGIRFETLRARNVVVPKYLDFDILETLGLRYKVENLGRRIQWEKFMNFNFVIYEELTLEFFTSLQFEPSNPNEFWFRFRGQSYQLNYEIMCDIGGFPKSTIVDQHDDFHAKRYWTQLTGSENFNAKSAPNNIIRSPEHLLLHKFMCQTVFGKSESNKCSLKELFILWCMDNDIQVCTTTHIFNTIITTLKKRSSSLGMGYLVTAIADYYGVNCDGLTVLLPDFLNHDHLTRAEFLTCQHMELRDISAKSHVKNRIGQSSSSSVPPQQQVGESTSEELEEQEAARWEKVLNVVSDNNKLLKEMAKEQQRQRRDIQRIYKYFVAQGIKISSPMPSPPQSP